MLRQLGISVLSQTVGESLHATRLGLEGLDGILPSVCPGWLIKAMDSVIPIQDLGEANSQLRLTFLHFYCGGAAGSGSPLSSQSG